MSTPVSSIEPLRLEFGLQPPPTAIAAWGGRLIYTGKAVDVVHNRQSTAGDAILRRLIVEFLCEPRDKGKGVLESLAAKNRFGPTTGSKQFRETYEFRGKKIVVEANPNCSGGYLYVVAYVETE